MPPNPNEPLTRKILSEHHLKIWLDERLADIRKSAIPMAQKDDRRIIRLVDMLRQKKVLDDPEVKELLNMEPFALSS